MRAFAVRSFGEPASVHELPVPAAEGAVLIRVRFAGVNPLDSNLPGRLTAASPYPFVVGIDFAGVAERVPAGDHGLRAGVASSTDAPGGLPWMSTHNRHRAARLDRPPGPGACRHACRRSAR